MLDSWKDRRAIRRLLGPTVQIEERVQLRRTAEARTTVLSLAGHRSRYVLKTYRRATNAHREAETLGAVRGLTGVSAPRCYGAAGGWVVRQFIEGKTLAALQQEMGFTHCLGHYASAVEGLAAIHAAREAVAARTALHDPFRRPILISRLRRAFRRIERVGFARYAARAGELPESWSTLPWVALMERLTEDLHTDPKLVVLGHGDYCAANLIVATPGHVVAIDWDQLSLATPWRDLGRLLRFAPEAHWLDLIRRYFTARGESERLPNLSESRSLELLESGILYDCLLVARIAAKSMRYVSIPGATDDFREALDTLVERST